VAELLLDELLLELLLEELLEVPDELLLEELLLEELLLELLELTEWLDHEELLSLLALLDEELLDCSSIDKILNLSSFIAGAVPGKNAAPVWNLNTESGVFIVPFKRTSRSDATHIVLTGRETVTIVAAAPALALY